MAKVTRLSLDAGGLDRRRIHLREISPSADAPLETIGEDLRLARQRKGEDLAQVSMALKIRKDHLQALEDSNVAALPGRAYAIGFVRAYAQYLGLDPAESVERLKTEIAGRDEAQEAVSVSMPRERRLPAGGTMIVVLLAAVLLYGGYYLIVSANRMTAVAVTPVPDRLAAQAGLNPAPAPSSAAASAKQPVQNDTQVAPASDPATQSTAAAASQTAAAPVQATPVVPLPPGQTYGARNANARIVLRIHKPVRLSVTGPKNEVYLNRILEPGDTYRAPNTVGLKLSAPDGGAVELILDGTTAGYAAKDGQEANMSLNPQDVIDRERPR